MDSMNMIAYMHFRGDLNWHTQSWGEVDGMILTQLSSLDYTDCMPCARNVQSMVPGSYKNLPTIHQVADAYFARRETQENRSQVETLLAMAAESVRFGEVRMDAFVRETVPAANKKFSAVTFYLSPWRAHISYRGTDGSFISWKENFVMTYRMPIPSQEDAVLYLEKITSKPFLKVSVGGHSKGGNMAIYAASYCKEQLQRKLVNIYSFDGPGFIQNIEAEPGFLRIAKRITALAPVDAVVCHMMSSPCKYVYVDSDSFGIRQHGMMHWQVDGRGLIRVADRSDYSKNMDATVNGWSDTIPLEERAAAVEEIFGIFEKNGVLEFEQLFHMEWRQTLGVLRSATGVSAQAREWFISMVKMLWDEYRRKPEKS